MKEIKLTQGKVAFIDDDDYERVSQYKWFAIKDRNLYYSKCRINNNKNKNSVYLHSFIMGEDTYDHIDGNTLNNCKSNLRKCNQQENCWNRNKSITEKTTSKYKGVSLYKNYYVSRITYNNKTHTLGYFKNEIDAALAYNKKAKELFGEFAKLNVIV